MAVNREPILSARGICKSFSGVEVLHGVDFTLGRGEVHGLAGANGAGKSTLMKILNGVYHLDEGEVHIAGEAVHIESPLDAAAAGLSMVFQEFSLVPTMTVCQNIFLAREPRRPSGFIDDKESRRRTEAILSDLQMPINPDAVVEDLPVGTRQVVEIAKALSKDCRILILDEPTASLSGTEIEVLFTLLRRLKEKGISIIIITHHLQEIMDICDRTTVLRDGDVVLDAAIGDITLEDIMTALVGREVTKVEYGDANSHHAAEADEEPVLEVKDLHYAEVLHGVNFVLRKGEVLGLAGLLGSGRTEILKNIYGLMHRKSGDILVNGMPSKIKHPADARNSGVSFVPEHRHEDGIIRGQSVHDNIMLPVWNSYAPRGFIRNTNARLRSDVLIERLRIKTLDGNQLIEQLSGGNQQKAVMAKAIVGEVEILLLDEPTVGVDVASKQEILASVRTLADEGKAVLMVSSEMEELAQVCDRVLVLRGGRVIGSLDRAAGDVITEDLLMAASQGNVA